MKYAVVIDAGSSGSRTFVYSWPDPDEYIRDMSPSSVLRQALLPIETRSEWVLKVQPGISSYSQASDSAIWKEHLQPLLQKALAIVPSDVYHETPIYFLATAGLRLLEETDRNRLLATVCKYLQSETKFSITSCDSHVTMIDGQTEGLYGWLGLNYLVHWGLAKQWDNFNDTYGFLDMGGASAQLAYASSAESEHKNDLHTVRIRNAQGDPIEWHVFVTTWLGYGANQARSRYRDQLVSSINEDEVREYESQQAPVPVFDPCLPMGSHETSELGNRHTYLFQGSGDWAACENQVSLLLKEGVPCEDEPCLFDGVHVPDFNLAEGRFVGVSEYWYTMQDLFGTDGKFDYSTLEPKVSELCSRPWEEIQQSIARGELLRGGTEVFSEGDIQKACFKSAWVLTVLNKGFKFPLSPENPSVAHNFQDTFQSAMEIEGSEISWTLGRAVLYASSQITPASVRSNPENSKLGNSEFGNPDTDKVGITTLSGEFLPGGSHYTSEQGKLEDVRAHGSTGVGVFGLLFIIIVLAAIAGFIIDQTEYRHHIYGWPLVKRLKRKMRLLWSNDDQQRTASTIGYGYSYPHADIPLSTLSTASRPQFRVPSRVSSQQNIASDHTLL